MSENNKKKKNNLQMYPGVSLGSAPKKRSSGVKIIILIVIVIAGASAGGYWINSKFISPQEKQNNSSEIHDKTTEEKTENDIVIPKTSKTTTDTTLDDINLDDIPQITTEDNSTELITKSSISEDEALDDILEGITQETPQQKLTEDTVSIADQQGSTEITEIKSVSQGENTAEIQQETIIDEPIQQTQGKRQENIQTLSGSIPDLLKLSDSYISQSKFSESAQILENLLNKPATELGKLTPDIYYRAGLTYRYLKNEAKTQENWLKAYQNFPETVSGRLAALGLADTWYYWYVDSKQDFSKWEAIRDAYSTAIGMDGARFLAPATAEVIARKLTKLNQKLVFDPQMPVTGAIFHTVQPGEYISTIAKKYGLGTWTSLIDINKINPKKS